MSRVARRRRTAKGKSEALTGIANTIQFSMRMKPKVHHIDGLLQIQYSLSCKIYDSIAYPVNAPNGSQVIIIGHETGLQIIWRGGSKPTDTKPTGANGHPNSAGSGEDYSEEEDEGEDDINQGRKKPFFGDEDDAEQTYLPIQQTLDLSLGTAILHLAVPKISPLSSKSSVKLVPAILEEKIVVAVACSDCSIRVLTIPLAPPSDGEKGRVRRMVRKDVTKARAGNGLWGDSMTIFSGLNGHKTLPQGVSIGFTPLVPSPEDGSGGGIQMSVEGDEDVNLWELIVASHSADMAGLLLVHKLALKKDGLSISPPEADPLWRTQHLASPAVSVDLHAPGAGAEDQTLRVLIASRNGPVKIYECTSPDPDRGRFLLSLFPSPYGSSISTLAARFITNGQAVLVLSSTGEYRVWDFSPKSASVISGAIPTPFSFKGYLSQFMDLVAIKSSSAPSSAQSSKLAPLTPHARKVRQEGLFGTKPQQPSSTAKANINVRGGITISPLPASSQGGGASESITIWYGDRAVLIHSASLFLRSKSSPQAGDPFAAGAPTKVDDLPNVDVGGQARVSVASLTTESTSARSFSSTPDALVTTESSLIIVMKPLLQEEKRRDGVRGLVHRSNADQRTGRDRDQMLLGRGELDVEGMERLLDGMADTNRERTFVGSARA